MRRPERLVGPPELAGPPAGAGASNPSAAPGRWAVDPDAVEPVVAAYGSAYVGVA
jgi:hypothetical protein